MSLYPNDLIPLLQKKCLSLKKVRFHQPPELPSQYELQSLFDVAFQASFLTEEGRRSGFRVVYATNKEIVDAIDRRKSTYFDNNSRVIEFDNERPYSVSEINRLAPAAEFTRLMICVSNNSKGGAKPKLVIWGLLDVGDNWWKFVHHETSGGRCPPNHITVTCCNPGELSISSGGDVYYTLKSGEIVEPKVNPIWHGAIDTFFQSARKSLYNETIKELKTKKWDESGEDDDYPYRFYNYFLERVLFYIREKAHGGTIIFIPRAITKNDTRLTDRAVIKYPCTYNFVWDTLKASLINHRRFYDLHFPLWDEKIPITKDKFRIHNLLDGESIEIEEGLSDIAQAIASLTSVDGAVILNDRFEVLGFGAEVTAVSQSLKDIYIMTNKGKNKKISIESFGTRHRSAFRFCSSFEDSVAFVVSQDGGVKAVKRVASEVQLWPDINSGGMGI